MNLAVVVDENVPPSVCDFLRKKRAEWQVWHVSEVGLKGASDETIFRWAQAHRAIVLTFDEDFADTRMYPTGSHAGVIRLRIWPTTTEQTEDALQRPLDGTQDGDLPGSLIIIDNQRIRVRKSARHD